MALRRAWPLLGGLRRRPDLRALKEEHIDLARERIFGPQGDLPGDRQFRKKLEGRQLMRWYFPSKYNLQDFRVDEYFEMQAERFAPREPHASMPALTKTLEKVSRHREELRSFFQDLDEATFLENPSLQDLYGAFRLVDPEPALRFPVPERVFREHTPLMGPAPPFRAAAAAAAPSEAADAEADMGRELCSLLLLIKEKLGQRDASALESRVTRLRSLEEVRTVLVEEATRLDLILPLEEATVVFEGGDPPPEAKSASEASEARQGAAEGAPAPAEVEVDVADLDAVAEGAEASGWDAEASAAHPAQRPRAGLATYLVRPDAGANVGATKEKAAKELERLRTKGPREVRAYLARRHRFVDPMFRRRRLKWLERQMAQRNKEKEVKFNLYYATHPDDQKVWPTNKASVTVKWPSPYH